MWYSLHHDWHIVGAQYVATIPKITFQGVKMAGGGRDRFGALAWGGEESCPRRKCSPLAQRRCVSKYIHGVQVKGMLSAGF